tara:strand:- start:305 stop:550 length:246 start_codon:yes stop_codon:yes gene_type:complete
MSKALIERFSRVVSGLEKSVDIIIERDAPHLKHSYSWQHGMMVHEAEAVPKLVEVLNKTGLFGKASFNVTANRIIFGRMYE